MRNKSFKSQNGSALVNVLVATAALLVMTPFLFQQVQDQLRNRASQREVIAKALRASGVQLASVSPNVLYQSYLYGTNASGTSRFGSGAYSAWAPSPAPTWPAGRRVNVALRACLGGFTGASGDWTGVTAAATGELDGTATITDPNVCASRDNSDHSLLWYHTTLFDPNDGHLIAGPNPLDSATLPKDRAMARYTLKGEVCPHAIGTAEYNTNCVLEVKTLMHPICSGDEMLISPPPPVAYRGKDKTWVVEGLPGPKLQAALASLVIRSAEELKQEAHARIMQCLYAVRMDFDGNKYCDPVTPQGYYRCPSFCADALPGAEWCCSGGEDTFTNTNTSTSTSTGTGGACHVENFMSECSSQFALSGQYVAGVQCVGGVGLRCTASNNAIYDAPGSTCVLTDPYCTGTGTSTGTGTGIGGQVDSCQSAVSVVVRYIVGPAPGVSVNRLSLVRTIDSAYQPDGSAQNVLDQPQTKVCGQIFKAIGAGSGLNNVLGSCL